MVDTVRTEDGEILAKFNRALASIVTTDGWVSNTEDNELTKHLQTQDGKFEDGWAVLNFMRAWTLVLYQTLTDECIT